MRTLFTTAAVMVLALVALAVAGDTDKPWMDPQNCAFCKEVVAQPGLKDHMRHEYHNIHNGIISVTYVDKEYWDEFAGMQAGMKKVVESMSSGQMPQMCQHCAKIGEFYGKGVKMEDVKSAEAIIIVYSHSDPEVIKDVQAFGARCNEEMAKMAQKM